MKKKRQEIDKQKFAEDEKQKLKSPAELEKELAAEEKQQREDEKLEKKVKK